MNTEKEISLHQKITDEIERNYRKIDLVGKHHASILIAVISLIGVIGIGISEINNFFSDWIIASNIFFAAIVAYNLIKSCLSLRENSILNIIPESLPEKQRLIYYFLILDAGITYMDSVFRGLGVILLTNLFIVMLFISDLVQGNYIILQNDISLILISVPAWIWFILQTISFFIIIWFITNNGKMIRLLLYKDISRKYPEIEIDELNNQSVAWYYKLFLGISIVFFVISILITVSVFWIQITNISFIFAIIIIQFVIFELLNDFFSANNLVRDCFLKIYQLDAALTVTEEAQKSKNFDLLVNAEDLYQNVRIFIPIKIDKHLFLSNYIFIPNAAYIITEDHQERLLNYLKNDS